MKLFTIQGEPSFTVLSNYLYTSKDSMFVSLSGSLEPVGLFGSTLIQIDTLGTLFSGRKRELEDNIQIIDTSVCSCSNYLFFSIR